MSELILCIEAKNIPDMGNKSIKKQSLDSITEDLLKPENLWFIPRPVAEKDKRFLQIIPYVVVSNPDGEILTYKRPTHNTDERLKEKWSIGVGGHINIEDNLTSSLESILVNSATREIKEEFNIWKVDSFLPDAALIFDPSNEVGEVHLGVAMYLTISYDTSPEPDPREIDGFAFYTLSELKLLEAKNALNLENWSRFLIKG